MNKELTLEEAENIVDNMYQNRWKEYGVEDGNTIHMGNLNNLQYTELESASILLLRTEIRLQQENKKLQKENEKLHHYKTLYQSLKRQKEELRSWLEEKIQYIDTIYLGTDRKNYSDDTILDMSSRKWGYKDTLNKLEELEGVNDEN